MSVASVPVSWIAEALLTQMSMPPNAATVFSTAVVDVGLVAHVDDQRQRLAAGVLDLLGGGVDGAGQVLVRLGGLGGDGDVGAVPGGAQGDGQADAAAGAGDEQGLAGKAHGVPPQALAALGRAVPIDPGRIAVALGAAAAHQTVEVRQALAGRHARAPAR